VHYSETQNSGATDVIMDKRIPRIAAIIPCFNEEAAIAGVINALKAAYHSIKIYVIDNNSNDKTAFIAEECGAVVITEMARGKGNAVRRAFAEIDADFYVMIDGDGTYDVASVPFLIERLQKARLDMIVGIRKANEEGCFRPGHRFGNRLFNSVIQRLFKGALEDVFSGYRVFSRRFIKSFPALSSGFEIETELTVHALELRLPIEEMPTKYFERVAGSESKLRTVRDGIRILWTLFLLTKQYRPFFLYTLIAAILATVALWFGIPVVTEFFETGLVPRLPTALLATGIMLLSAMSFMTALLLHSISRNALETKRLHYLRMTLD
jgi:glycosyltransferase involved in cell wall biosynthesis